MNKFGKTIPEKIVGKLELILDMLDQVIEDHEDEIDKAVKLDLLAANKLIFAHANTDEEFFNDD